MDYPGVGPCAVQAVLLVERFVRNSPNHRFVAHSLPGHLIQCTVRGTTEHEANGRQYVLSPGDVIWYHEDELVKGRVCETPWIFYSVNFIAPALDPPPFEARVQHVDAAVVEKFGRLLDTWRNLKVPPALREWRVQSCLLDLIAHLYRPRHLPIRMTPAARFWWEIETVVRRDLTQHYTLPRLERISGSSQATIARSCLAAVGVPPIKRIKQIRMSMARGLVQRSDLSLKQIAARVGFGRLHEFSRDYRKCFGLPPSADRSHAPASA